MKSLDYIRFILLPFIPLYRLLIKFRNFLFDKNIFKITNIAVPIISIGNLTIGGSGKTPMTIYITKLLMNSGFKPGVLSRGYGRKSKGYLLVSENSELLVDVEKSGDEIVQTVLECRVPAAVSENRVEGAKKILEDTNADVLILDDAYQHRWINRDINILIFEQRHLTTSNKLRRLLLPTGNMREPFSCSKRADVIVINRKFSDKSDLSEKFTKHFSNKPVFYAYYKSIGFVDLKTNNFYKPEDFLGQKSLILSGIANPISFINALKKINVETANHIILRDHEFYSIEDINRIRKEFYALNAQSVITTQKDAARLTTFLKELDDIDIYYLKIELVFDNEEEFNKYIIKRINNLINIGSNNNLSTANT